MRCSGSIAGKFIVAVEVLQRVLLSRTFGRTYLLFKPLVLTDKDCSAGSVPAG